MHNRRAEGSAGDTRESAGQRPILQLTGERTLPGVTSENYWFRRHEAGYLALAPFCRGAVLLEVGAGEGYGTAALAATARRVVALEYDETAARHARATYPQLGVIRGNAVHLPVATGTVDVVASFQVLEHLWDQPGFLAECARVLAPAGTLLLTTPNRLTFPPGNPFHTTELSAAELRALLEPRFEVTRMYGLTSGWRLRRMDRRHPGCLTHAQLATPPAVWHPQLRLDVKRVRAGDFAIVTTGLDAALDLLAVAVRASGPRHLPTGCAS